MVHLNSYDQVRLQRLVEHVHRCGARATAEAFAEVALRIGGLPCVLTVLSEYEQRLSPALLRATGGDRFAPRPLHLVPSDVVRRRRGAAP